MGLQVWLHEATGDESGWTAWGLDVLGFATWAETRSEVLARVPAKLAEHRTWLLRHGLPVPELSPGLEVAEEARGDEILFGPDRAPASPAEIDRTIQVLGCTRLDLLVTVEHLPPELLGWDPPYRRFAPWAGWRTIDAILAHVANTETHYYLPRIGYESPAPTVPPDGAWRELMHRRREEAVAFLHALKRGPDLARVTEADGAGWSVRKVLRRLVRHELLHWKSIRRIVAAYARRSA